MDGAAAAGHESLDPLEPGSVISGKYEISRLLGEGGMGLVYEARHLRLGHRVAIKILHPDANEAPSHAARFEREARAAARLSGRHVARVYDVDTLPDGALFMVMEHLQGRDLSDEILLRGSIPAAEAVRYVLDACEAMAEAHRAGIVHRDLKPANLYVTDVEGGRIVKVLDFGISKLVEEGVASVTRTQSSFGTPHYMSPEQVRSTKHVDGRSDIWSLGIILYEMLGGVLPFAGDSATAIIAAIAADTPVPLHELRPDLPRGLCDAVMVALAKSPDERFATIEAFATAIEPYAEGGPRAHELDAGPTAGGALAQGFEATVALGDPAPAARASTGDRRRPASWAARPRTPSASAPEAAASGAALAHAPASGDVRSPTVPSAPPTEVPATEPRPPVPRSTPGSAPRGRVGLAVAGLAALGVAALAVVLLTRGPTTDPGASETEASGSSPARAAAPAEASTVAVTPAAVTTLPGEPPVGSAPAALDPAASASSAAPAELPVKSAGGAPRPPTTATGPASSPPSAAPSAPAPSPTSSARKFRTTF
ncbi:MAG: protein kinase [Polyangiaceae bacterium]|nr:protein kinase [Polyangiaceae bacterium]